jgi:hypothetical protein
MLKSFYSKQFVLSMDFMSEGVLVGLFKATGKKILIHEFTGIYQYRNAKTIDLSFSIGWYAGNHNSKYFTMFSGVTESQESFELMALNWVLIDENELDSGYVSSSVTLLSDDPYGVANLCEPSLNPFPEFGIEMEFELN